MRRETALAPIVAIVVALFVSVLVQVWAIPAEVAATVAAYPEVKSMAAPAIILGAIAVACWQAALAIALWLLILVRRNGVSKSAYMWLWAMVGCLLGFIGVVVSGFVSLSIAGYSTPAMLGLIAAGGLGVIAVVSLVLFIGTRPVARYQARRN